MSPSDIDFHYVRRYTTWPLLSAVVAAALLVVAISIHEKQVLEYSQFNANRDAIHEDYDALVYQRRLVDRYHRRYQRFHDLGFIGRESRLDWIETLRTTSESLSLPRVSYAIEPQLSVVAPVQNSIAADDVQIRVSRAQLELGLVHELDLLRFFDALQALAPGLIRVDQCELTWLGEDARARANDANLTASCAVQIFSVITSDVGRSEVGS